MKQKLILLAIFLISSGILFGCEKSSKVEWYVIDGVEWANEKAQLKISPIQPEKGEPSSTELTQLALDRDPSFFTEVNLGEITYLTDIPAWEDFKGYLIGQGYTKLGAHLVAVKVTGSLPTGR
jgi:hypothetical protein